LDLYRNGDDGARDIVGVSFGADRLTSHIRNIYDGTRAGSVSMDGYTLGGYWTRKGASGWYVDSVVQVSRYDSIHASSSEGQELDTSGSGISLSLEAGYPFTLGDQWKLEPQGQVVYQHVSLSGGHDDYGLVNYNGSDALSGRLGVRLVRDWKLGSGYPITSWARVNVWGVMGPEPKTSFSGLDGLDTVAFRTTLGTAWWDVQLGLSGQVSRRVSLFGSLDYDRPLSSANGHGVGGRVGLRVAW
jgi:outer membrane autotransporter protein